MIGRNFTKKRPVFGFVGIAVFANPARACVPFVRLLSPRRSGTELAPQGLDSCLRRTYGFEWLLGREVYLDICRDPMQRLTYNSRNRRGISIRRTAPETRHMRLKIAALHEIAEFAQALAVISKWKDKSHQSFKMVDQILARNFAPDAEIPNTGFPNDLGAMRTGAILLTLSICSGRLFLYDPGNFVRVECGRQQIARLQMLCSDSQISL